MRTLINLTKSLCVREEQFTFPVSTNVSSSFPFDLEFKDINPNKDNYEIRSGRHDRRQNDLRTVREQEVLVDMQTQAIVHNVGSDTDSKVRDRAVPTSPVRGQYVNKQKNNKNNVKNSSC